MPRACRNIGFSAKGQERILEVQNGGFIKAWGDPWEERAAAPGLREVADYILGSWGRKGKRGVSKELPYSKEHLLDIRGNDIMISFIVKVDSSLRLTDEC